MLRFRKIVLQKREPLNCQSSTDSAALGSSLYSLKEDPTENTAANSSSYCCYGRFPNDSTDIVSAGTCLPSRYSATHVPSRVRCTATVLHATILIQTPLEHILTSWEGPSESENVFTTRNGENWISGISLKRKSQYKKYTKHISNFVCISILGQYI
jgi:hypothetical protein